MSRLPRLRSTFLCLYRAGVLVAVALMLHYQARWFDVRRTPAISVRHAKKYFPKASRVQLRDTERGLYFVTDARGSTIGCLLTTSPETDNIIGYSGPNNLLIALDPTGAVAGIELLRSGDTPEYVARIRSTPDFLRTFVGWKPAERTPPKPEAISGATLTSFAIAESVQKRLTGAAASLRFPEPVTLEEVRGLFTNAAHLTAEKACLRVSDRANRLLGFVVRTSPQTDNVSGYRGPTECLAALAPDGRTITAMKIRTSYDTEGYVDQVRRAQPFFNLFVGRSIDELAQFDWANQRVDGISGATLTARAAAEGLKRRFAAELRERASATSWRPKSRDIGLAGVIAGAMVMSFSSLRRHRWLRFGWQVVLIAYVGLVNRDFLSLALLNGWASNGVAFKLLPGLVLLAVAGLLVPLTTRRPLYCHNICPHGAAQEILGKFGGHWSVPSGVARVLSVIPGLLLGFALLTAVLGIDLHLASLEPFDAWIFHGAGWASIGLAICGLGASLFVPQAYCRFGCPTGAFLKFLRSGGHADRWGRRDWAALACVVGGIITLGGVRSWPRVEPESEPVTLRGPTMGTTWAVKIRDEVADAGELQNLIAREFEWAESLTSNWRTNTDLSVFNRSRTTEPAAVPWPVITLCKRGAEISRATGGAYDLTVGPLVRLWGFGPNASSNTPPADAAIAAVRPAIGWEKLKILDGMIQKEDAALEVDLSSITEGWAIDHVASALDRRGFTNYLVELGGELRGRGVWNIAIEHPTRSCTLSNESIGTAGTYRQKHEKGSATWSHLIDPRTGRPITHDTVSVSVRHADCGQADPWATALNVLGVEAGLPLAEKLGLAAQFVTEPRPGELRTYESAAWKARNTSPAVVRR